MKTCPACNRSYGDETLVFCLEDGTRLVQPALAPTIAYPSQSDSEQSTITVVSPASYRPQPVGSKRSALPWLFLAGVLILFIGGLTLGLVYLVWKVHDSSLAQSSSSVTNSNENQSTVAANANTELANENTATKRPLPNSNVTNSNSTGTEDPQSLSWLEGVWKGEGYQTDTSTTWAMTLTVHDGDYAIDYPDIPCSGRWELDEKSSRGASFTEVLSQGADRCSDYGHVTIEKQSDTEITCRFTRAGKRDVVATAVLGKKRQ